MRIGRALPDNQAEFLSSGFQVAKKSQLQVLHRNALRVRANIQGRNHSSGGIASGGCHRAQARLQLLIHNAAQVRLEPDASHLACVTTVAS